jgi:uncharacterized membrane protein
VKDAQPIPSKRLYFIDIARSIAILLMLQGHFVDTTLADEFRDERYLAYQIWSYIRQFTSAVFLTVTGIVFTYLLLNQSGGYFQNQRIRKGLKRVLELFFWGYLLQPRAFHVLQCIGVGLLFIITLYRLSLLIKKLPLSWYFLLASVALFASNLYFGALKPDIYWPENAPEIVQNIFHGPTSVFPITPYLGFTLFGAFLGSTLVGIKEKIHSWKFIVPSFSVGFLLVLFSKPFLIYLNGLPSFAPVKVYLLDWIFLKIGMVLLVLSLLIAAEAFWLKNLQSNLFLKLGQNTLSIFIIHMFILYGPGIRYSIQKYFDHGLNAIWIAPSALVFILFFVLYVYLLDRYRNQIKWFFEPIKSRTNRLFGIKD